MFQCLSRPRIIIKPAPATPPFVSAQEATEAIDFDDAGVQLIGTGGQINAKTGKYDVALDADGNPSTTVDESKNKILAGIEVKAITTINAGPRCPNHSSKRA